MGPVDRLWCRKRCGSGTRIRTLIGGTRNRSPTVRRSPTMSVVGAKDAQVDAGCQAAERPWSGLRSLSVRVGLRACASPPALRPQACGGGSHPHGGAWLSRSRRGARRRSRPRSTATRRNSTRGWPRASCPTPGRSTGASTWKPSSATSSTSIETAWILGFWPSWTRAERQGDCPRSP